MNRCRIFRSSISVACFFLVSAALAQDSTTPAESLEQQVARLVEQLDAAQASSRQAAESELIDLGESIGELLPDADNALPPEAKRRLERVRAAIAKLSASKAANERNLGDVRLAGATTLTMALEAISRDSRIEFEHRAPPETPIQPFVSPLPFWHALDYVLDQANLDIDFYGGETNTLALVPRRSNRPSRVDSSAYADPFRLEPMMVTSRRVLHDAGLSGLSVELELSWKPDVQPVGITLPLGQLVAKLDDGATATAQSADGTIDIAPTANVPMAMVQLPLSLPAGRPTKIVALSGRIESMLPGEIKPFEFALSQGTQTQTADSVTVVLEQVRANGPLHEIRLGVEFKSPGKAMESHRGWLLGNEVSVTMPDGSRQDHLGYELYRHNENGIGIGYLFDIGAEPGEAKLVYRTPTSVVRKEIDFVIQDISMP